MRSYGDQCEGERTFAPYDLPLTATPHANAGKIFALFAIVCAGNETYLSASYWHVVATTLDALTMAYAGAGATGGEWRLTADDMGVNYIAYFAKKPT